jgi:hypothetical protein
MRMKRKKRNNREAMMRDEGRKGRRGNFLLILCWETLIIKYCMVYRNTIHVRRESHEYTLDEDDIALLQENNNGMANEPVCML